MPSQSNRDDERSAIEQLEQRVHELKQGFDARRDWTSAEIEALDAMISMWRGFKALGFLMGSVKTIIIWIGVFAAALIAFRSGILDWLGLGAPK